MNTIKTIVIKDAKASKTLIQYYLGNITKQEFNKLYPKLRMT